MPLTIRDAEDAAHSAVMDVEAWAQEFEKEWLRPVIEMQQAQSVEQVLMFWQALPPEAHAQMMKQNPEQYAQIVKQVDALKRKQKEG